MRAVIPATRRSFLSKFASRSLPPTPNPKRNPTTRAATPTTAVIGPILLWLIPEALYAAEEYRLLLYGLVVVLVIIFMPHGVAGRLKSLSPRISELLP